MSGLTGAAIGGGLAAVGTIGGAAISSGASKEAANTAAAAQEKALQTQERLARESIAAQTKFGQKALDAYTAQYNQSRADLQPFQQAQLAALQQAQGLTDANNPIYQQRRQQVTQAIQRQLAAQGLLRSKNQLDLLTGAELGLEEQRIGQINALANLGAVQAGAAGAQQYGQGLASLYSGQGQQIGSTLSGLAGMQGQGIAQIGQIYGNAAAQQGQIWAGALQGVGNIAQGTYGNMLAYQQFQQNQKLVDRLTGGGAALGANTAPGMFGMVGR